MRDMFQKWQIRRFWMKTIAWALVACFAFGASGAVWTNGNWSVAENWTEGVVPEAGVAVTISPVSSGQTLTVDVDSVSVSSLVWEGQPFTLNGGTILISSGLHAKTKVVCRNNLSFSYNYASMRFDSKCTLNGAIEASGAQLKFGGGGGADFYGSVSVPNGSLDAGIVAWATATYNFYAPVKVKNLGLASLYEGLNAYFHSAGNGWTGMTLGYSSFHPRCAGALPETTVVKFNVNSSSGYVANGSRILNLLNSDQTIDRITTPAPVAGKDLYFLRSRSGNPAVRQPAKLTLKATADNENYLLVEDAVTVIYAPIGDFTQTFLNRTHTTSGDIIVSNGTFRVGGTSTFANVKRIVVADGATFDLSTEAANALAGVTNIVLGAGARFAIAAAAVSPFAASVVELELAEDSVFELPEGANYLFKSIKVADAYLDGGSYTGGGDSPFAGSGAVTLPDIERESVDATWVGGGEDDNIATAANWQEESLPALKEGSLVAFFAAGGDRAEVSTALDFKGLRFGGESAEFTLEANSSNASLSLRQSGIDVAASHKAVLNVPLAVKSDQTWAIGANSSLELEDPVAMSTAYAIAVAGSGATVGSDASERIASVLKLDAENGYLGSINVSGALVDVNAVSNAFGHASDEPVRLTDAMIRLNGGVVERPVAISGQNNKYGWFCVQSGTNVFTKKLSQTAGAYWRPRLVSGTVLVTEGGVSVNCNAIVYGGGEWIVRGAPLKHESTDSSVCGLNLTGNETVRFEVAGNILKRLKLESACIVHCGVENPFSSTLLFMSSDRSTLDLNGHEVSFNRADSLKGGTVKSEDPGLLKFTAHDLVVTNKAVRFTGAAGLELRGTGTIVITNAIESAGRVSVAKGRLEFTESGSWANSTNVDVSGTGRLVLAKRKTFSRQAELTVADDGVLEIPAGIVVNVKTLRIGGKTFAAGTFGGAESSAENKAYAANFAGAGMVQVGNGLTIILR